MGYPSVAKEYRKEIMHNVVQMGVSHRAEEKWHKQNIVEGTEQMIGEKKIHRS